MREFKQVLTFINKNNPYEKEWSWYTLLSMIYKDINETTIQAKTLISDWLDNYM